MVDKGGSSASLSSYKAHPTDIRTVNRRNKTPQLAFIVLEGVRECQRTLKQ